MFGLCLPSGETFLLLKDGSKESIAITDETNPRKYIMEDKDILEWVKTKGYKNVEAIIYTRNGKETTIKMADYYAEHGQELEG